MSKKLQNLSRKPQKHQSRNKCLLAVFSVTALGTLASQLISKANRRAKRRPDSDRTKPADSYAGLLHALSQSMRSPLSGIMGNSLIYLENHVELNEEEKLKLVAHIHEDSERLVDMTENLLAFMQTRDMDLTVSAREEMVEEVLGEVLHKMDLRRPGSMIRASVPEHFVLLYMDAALIEQAIINLLENSLIRSGDGKPVDIIVQDKPKEVSFLIRDYGPPIPQEDLAGLFGGNLGIPSRTPDTCEKTGIGLAVCKSIITAHHGAITVRNHDRGAEFVFTLPKQRGTTR